MHKPIKQVREGDKTNMINNKAKKVTGGEVDQEEGGWMDGVID